MTREEAVEKLEAFTPMVVDDTREALDMAIEALQREEHLVELEAKAVAIIKSERHGEWVEEKDGWYGGQGCRCSVCGYGYSYKAYHEPYEFSFCPNCGAKMDKE